MKIHNPNDLEFDSQTLRALARGDLDPVRLAVEKHREQKNLPTQADAIPNKPSAQSARQKRSAGLPSQLSQGSNVARGQASERTRERSRAQSKGQSKAQLKQSAGTGKSLQERQAEYQALQQKREQLAEIVRQCEALEVLKFETLAMKQYPAPETIAAARRRRDIWLFSALFCLSLAFIGWQGLLSAWVAGVATGLLVILLAFALTPFRQLFYQLPTLSQLKSLRKAMEFAALNHVKMLEGNNGLAYQCQRMQSYRSELSERRFQRLVVLSKQGQVVKAIASVAGIRLYLSYLLEARQAFVVVKQEYMKTSGTLQKDYSDLALGSLQ